MTRAVYVWGETMQEILDNAATRLNMRKTGKYLYTVDGQQVEKIYIDIVLFILLYGNFYMSLIELSNTINSAVWPYVTFQSKFENFPSDHR